jgi:hypothetical protein
MAGDVPKGMPLCLSRSTSSERRALYGLFQRRHVKAGRFTGARRLSCYDEIRETTARAIGAAAALTLLSGARTRARRKTLAGRLRDALMAEKRKQ